MEYPSSLDSSSDDFNIYNRFDNEFDNWADANMQTLIDAFFHIKTVYEEFCLCKNISFNDFTDICYKFR